MERPFLFPAAIGVVVIIMSVVLLFVFPRNAPQLPPGFMSPIIAFEFAETEAEVKGLFGEEGSAAFTRNTNAMNKGNELDYIYMILYSLFLLMFCIRLYWQTGESFFLLVAFLSPLILAGDVLENIQLLSITRKIYHQSIAVELAQLHLWTWIKWGGLSLSFLCLSPFFIKNGGLSRFIGYFGIVTFVLAVSSYFYRPYLRELFSFSVALMFIFMILFSFLYRVVSDKGHPDKTLHSDRVP